MPCLCCITRHLPFAAGAPGRPCCSTHGVLQASCVLQQRRGVSTGFGQLSEASCVCYSRDKASRPASCVLQQRRGISALTGKLCGVQAQEMSLRLWDVLDGLVRVPASAEHGDLPFADTPFAAVRARPSLTCPLLTPLLRRCAPCLLYTSPSPRD